MLLVVKLLTFLMHRLILKTSSVVTQKSLDVRLKLQKPRVTRNASAEFFGFFDNSTFFDNNGHAR